MNALVKKEIRLLLPSWLAVLALEVSLPWIWRDVDSSFMGTPFFMFLGIILLSVDSFGRECSLGTFQALLAQPVERRQIWRTKIFVLLPAAVLILAAYFTNCELRAHLAVSDINSVWHVNPNILGSDFRTAMGVSLGLTFVALAGGLWTTLLLRQAAVAFWVAFLVPTGLFLLIALVMSKFFGSASEFTVYTVLCFAGALYTISGFWLAWRLWARAQDFAWTGGVISFSRWRYFDEGVGAAVSVRKYKPVSTLLTKEFQLSSIGLIGVGSLLVLHLGIFFLRGFYGNFHRNSMTDVICEMFWVLWLVVPLVIGCMAVAEERKLGMAEAQLCLPVSRRLQFFGKFIPVMIFGTLLGGVMPSVLEQVAGHLGAPNAFFKPESHSGNDLGIPGIVAFEIGLVLLAAALSLVGFYASTLARNFLQALSLGIVIIVGSCLFLMFLFSGPSGDDEQMALWNMKFWGMLLPLLISIPTALVLFPWLAYRNFSQMVEGGRLWRRNTFAIGGAVMFVLLSSGLIYNRAWEIFEPVEPAHGSGVFSTTTPPKLRGDFRGDLQVQFPGGRIWCDSLGDPYSDGEMNNWNWFMWALFHPLPVSAGPQQFIAGSNWVSATTRHIQFWNPSGTRPRTVAGYLDTVGVKADGTLWISSEARPSVWTGADMTRFDGGANWEQVLRVGNGLLLLKTDGTLWQWGTNNLDWKNWQTHWPTVRASQPQQLGNNSDWQAIFNLWSLGLAKKADGGVWLIDSDWKIERATNFDQINLQNCSNSGQGCMAFIRPDGTLWASINGYHKNAGVQFRSVFQIGRETNWVATAISWTRLVALGSDGILWQWHFQATYPGTLAEALPARLGIHNDWIGLSDEWDGVVTFATDGSLWFWPNPDNYTGTLMKAPKQPELLGHVSEKPN